MKRALFLLLIFSFSVGAQNKPAPRIKDKGLDNFFKEKTKIENPLELRDPFKAPQFKAEDDGKKKGFMTTGKGNYTNIGESNLEALLIQDMRVVGVLIGKERRALVLPKEGAKDVVILKEGMKIGPDKAELKAVLPGGIILVEKIINVYGQEEYLETVIPISR